MEACFQVQSEVRMMLRRSNLLPYQEEIDLKYIAELSVTAETIASSVIRTP